MRAIDLFAPFTGSWSGDGVSNEGDRFGVVAEIGPRLGGRAVEIELVARASGGKVLHESIGLVVDHDDGRPRMHVFANDSRPAVLEWTDTPEGAHVQPGSIQFRAGRAGDTTDFRERITFRSVDENQWEARWEWGLPGGDFLPRSGATLRRASR